MRKAKLIIHPEDAERIALEKNSKEALKTWKNIEEAMASEDSFTIPDSYDPRKLSDSLKNYDFVEIYGARHGMCLTGVDITLTLMNIKHSYAPNGYF